jgi:hypothetical protein
VRLHAQAPDDSLKPGIAVGARDLPRGSRAKKVPSTFAVAAVGGVRLLAELAERRFVFALDLIEALMDEGKVIGYSCCHWEPLKRRGLFVPIFAVSEPTPSTEAPYLVRARDYIFVIELKNRRLKISPQQAGALKPALQLIPSGRAQKRRAGFF